MKTKTLSFAFLCITSLLFQSAAQESFLAPLVKESLLLDIDSDQSTIVVGARGHILQSDKSSPSIADLVQVVAPTKATLTAVDTIGSRAWAVGHDATILSSNDGGKNWQTVLSIPELDRPFLDVLFFDEQEGIAVGAYGLFYRTVDGGNSWTQESHPSVLSEDDNAYLDTIKEDEAFYLEELSFISPHFNRLHFSGDKLYMAGEAGLLAVSEDKGRNWQRLEIDYYGSFFDLTVLENGNLFAVGLRGNIFVLMNEQWQSIPSCITTTLNSLRHHQNNMYVAGNNGVILKVDVSKISDQALQNSNNESCERSTAVSQINTDFSDAILRVSVRDDSLVLVTAGGLKSVVVQ